MARIPYADTRPGAPGTPEFTMAQEGRRKAKGEEEEFMEIYRMLLEMQKDPSLPSSEMQEVDDLIEDMDISGYGREEAGLGSGIMRGAGRFLGKATKSPTAQRILSGVQTSAKAIKDRAARILGDIQLGLGKPMPKAKTMPGQPGRKPGLGKRSRPDEPDLPGDFGAGRRSAAAGARAADSAKKASTPWNMRQRRNRLRAGAGAVGAAGMVGLGILDQFEEEEEEQPQRPEAGAGRREDVIIGPEAPPTRPATEDPETPSRRPRGGHPGNRRGRQGPGGTWRDDPPYPPETRPTRPEEQPEEIPTDQDIEGLFNGEGVPSKFAGRGDTEDVISAAYQRELAEAFGGTQDLKATPSGFIDTPEGQAFLQQRMTSMSPDEIAEQAQPSPGAQPEPIPRDIPSPQVPPPPGMPRPTLPMPGVEEDQPEDAQFQEDILDASARSFGGRPDPGPPTDDDIIGLFEGRGVPVSQLSEEEAQAQLEDIASKLREESELPLTEEEQKRFMELIDRKKRFMDRLDRAWEAGPPTRRRE